MTGGSRQPDRHPPKAQLIGKAEDPPDLVVKSYSTLNIQNNPIGSLPAASPSATPDFFQAAIEHAGIPVVGLDCSGLICCWNQTASRLFGRSSGEMIGKTMDLLIPSAYRSIAWRAPSSERCSNAPSTAMKWPSSPPAARACSTSASRLSLRHGPPGPMPGRHGLAA